MKTLVLIGGLLCCGATVAAQKAPPVGKESAQSFKGATTIIVQLPDSASAAYAKLLRGLLAAGYGIDKSNKQVLYVSTPPKPLKDVFGLIIESNAAANKAGSTVTFRGRFTWASAIAIAAHADKKEMEVRCMGKGSTPIQQMWLEMQRVATECFPSGGMSYK